MLNKPITWIITFTLIMALAVIYLFSIDTVTLGPFGIPTWIYGFLVIELIYSGAMYVFVTKFWKNEETAE